MALALILVLAVSIYRVLSGAYLTSLPNFSPVMAMAFCCGFALPGALAFIIPLATLFVSDVLLDAHYGAPLLSPEIISVYACYIVAIGLGRLFHNAGFLLLAGATVFDSLLFYVITNSASWIHNPHYAQSFSGWVQALTVGRPDLGFPPTWQFFRNSLVSDLLFTAAFLLMFSLVNKQEPSAAVARRQAV